MNESERQGLDGFHDDVARWHAAVPDRVPGYHQLLDRLLALLDETTGAGADLRARFSSVWSDRSFVTFYDRPLLVFAALRAEALVAGTRHPLWDVMAAEPPASEVTREALLESFGPAWPRTFTSLARRFVQTNETSRAVAWLWPARLLDLDDGRPLALIDLGASAGLNLVADRLPAPWTDQDDAPLPVIEAQGLNARLRLGLDRNPIDLHDEEAARWLRACVWPGETVRQARLEAALKAMGEAFRAPSPPRVEAADAAAWPDRVMAVPTPGPGGLVLAYQTIVIEYLPADLRRRYREGMQRWIAARPRGEAVWLELEHDGVGGPRPAVLRATVPDEQGVPVELTLGRCGPHPQVIEVNAPDVERLRRLMARAPG